MPLLIASEIYGESTEDPPKNEPPLEARKIRFHWLASRPAPNPYLNQEGIWSLPPEFDGYRWLASGPGHNAYSNQEGTWNPLEFDGVDVPTYMFRYDMINGGRRARTGTEEYMENFVRTFVEVHAKFKGWQVIK